MHILFITLSYALQCWGSKPGSLHVRQAISHALGWSFARKHLLRNLSDFSKAHFCQDPTVLRVKKHSLTQIISNWFALNFNYQ